MKAEIAVRSMSASISAWTARMAPRKISKVTGSQAPEATSFSLEAAAGFVASSIERSIRRVLDGDERRGRDERPDHDIGRRRNLAARLPDEESRDVRRQAAEERDGEAIAYRQGREAHLRRKELAQHRAKRPGIHGKEHSRDALREH